MSKSVDSSGGAPYQGALPREGEEERPASLLQEAFIGSVSAISAVFIIQPGLYFKNGQQSRSMQPQAARLTATFEKNPRVWYRGVGGFAASFAPTVALQTAATALFSTVMDPLPATSAAGVASALVSALQKL